MGFSLGREDAFDPYVSPNKITHYSIGSDLNNGDKWIQVSKRNRTIPKTEILLSRGFSFEQIERGAKWYVGVTEYGATPIRIENFVEVMNARTRFDQVNAFAEKYAIQGVQEDARNSLNSLRQQEFMDSSKAQKIISDLRDIQSRTESAFSYSSKTDPITGNAVVDEVYARALSTHQQMESAFDFISKQLNLSPSELNVVRSILGIDKPFISRSDFNDIYKASKNNKPTNLPEYSSTSHRVVNFAKSIDPEDIYILSLFQGQTEAETLISRPVQKSIKELTQPEDFGVEDVIRQSWETVTSYVETHALSITPSQIATQIGMNMLIRVPRIINHLNSEATMETAILENDTDWMRGYNPETRGFDLGLYIQSYIPESNQNKIATLLEKGNDFTSKGTFMGPDADFFNEKLISKLGYTREQSDILAAAFVSANNTSTQPDLTVDEVASE